MTVINSEDLRDYPEYVLEDMIDHLNAARNKGIVVENTPKTVPMPIIKEMTEASGFKKEDEKKDRSILVLYSLEIALYLHWCGYNNITVATIEEDARFRKTCDWLNMGYLVFNTLDNKDEWEYTNPTNKYHHEDEEMKFDCVIGNPPYSKKVVTDATKRGKSVQLWPDFVRKSFEHTADNGFVSLIIPSNWRDLPGSQFRDIWELLTGYDTTKVVMMDEKAAQKTFGITMKVDWWVVQKSPYQGETVVVDTTGKESIVDLNEIPFLPSANMDVLDKLIAKDGEEKVEIIHSYSAYETRKPWMSKEQTDEYKYPVVYYSGKTPNLRYSSTNENGHFGIQKVILSAPHGSVPFVDKNGDYGMTQFAFGIVDDSETLPFIEKAINHPLFVSLSVTFGVSRNKYDKRIIAMIKKDFWKVFVDENTGELINNPL